MPSYLQEQWYVCSWSHSLTDQPIGTNLLNERVVLWRDGTGRARAAVDQCPHRGTQLSLGSVDESGCITCPYHGWRFDSSGRCIEVPQNSPETAIPRKAALTSIACEERYGMIWLCLGEPHFSIPSFPEWTNPRFHHVSCSPYTWECSAERMLENFTDFGHLGYLHDGLLGRRDDLIVPEHQVTSEANQLRYQMTMVVPNAGESLPVANFRGESGLQTNTYVVDLPYTIHLQSYYHDTQSSRVLFFSIQPHSDGRATGYCYQSRDFDLEADDSPFVEFQELLAAQDQPIVESQRPVAAPLDLTSELHLGFDRVAIAYRRAMKRLMETASSTPTRVNHKEEVTCM
ncbi:MAG: Rieske 2Fe-2S domain-containing protein [Ferrimicrobium sp.]|uniref:Rieske 2Fe-2S domain-containing protein n=1 Tax=Ferrimicrobium acidiphilum TaxID=121039 RepID=A0ABV3Y2J7_9ACTN|nr:aromatic ring-hydroxylating dioxygenase subunit alpha [Ferrimicrobium acidiphilum]